MAKSKKSDRLPLEVGTDGIMETKLTRSEAIELMLQQALEDVERRQGEIKEQIGRLADVTPAQVATLGAFISRSVLYHGHYADRSTAQVSLEIDMSSEGVPEWLRKNIAEADSLYQEASRLYEVSRALSDKGKAKLQIMRQVLEASASGREFLKQVESMSLALNGRLLKAASEPKPKLQRLEVTQVIKVKEG